MVAQFQKTAIAIAFVLVLIGPALAAGGKPTLASQFSDFSVSDIHRKAPRYPDFRGRDRKYFQYRDAISERFKGKPTLAGKYEVIAFGCGTAGCNLSFAVDLTTGRVIGLPGGQFYPYLKLSYEVNSRLFEARWIKDGRCVLQKFVIQGAKLTPSDLKDVGSQDACPASPPSYPFSF
jgi:hypothetical protein